MTIQLQRLRAEDFPSEEKWIGQLLAPLNQFQERVVALVTNGLTVTDNLAGEVKIVRLDGAYPVKLPWSSPPPKAVLVGGLAKVNGGDAWSGISVAVQAQWEYTSSGILKISNVVGLTPTAANPYLITLFCLSG